MDRVRQSVVKIEVTGTAASGIGVKETGTGFFVDALGHILTAAHVVGNTESWQVDANTGLPQRRIRVLGVSQNSLQIDYTAAGPVVIVYVDRQVDLALLRVLATAPPLRLGSGVSATGGDQLRVVGYGTRATPVALPADLVMAFDPQLNGAYMRLKASVNPSDSGAPVFNQRREVVGIINGGSFLKPNVGETYATPTNMAAPIMAITGRRESDVPLGTVVSSLLDPRRFFQQYDVGLWVPADGRSVAGSAYAELTGVSQAPDLRGMFLRGLNTFDPLMGPRADKHEDPDGATRRVGDTQEQRVAGHQHPLGSSATDVTGNMMTPTSRRIPSYIADGFANAPPLLTGTNDSSGDNRPRNVSVFYYIRINDN